MSKNWKRHYFSIDSILATEEQLPCTFLKDDNYTGFLEPGSKVDKITAGSTLQLPFWIASSFVPHPRAVSVELPKPYKKAFRDVLKADATVVDLRVLSRFYFVLGQHLTKIKHKESVELSAILTKAFRGRFRMIMDWALNGATDQVRKLDWSELQIFNDAKKAQEVLHSWLTEDHDVIKASSMITSHKRRRITNTDLF